MRWVLLVGLAMAAGAGADEGSGPSPGERYRALVAEYERAAEDWAARFDGAEGVEELRERYERWPGWAFAPRFVALAESAPGDPAAVDAWVWVAELGNAVSAADRELLPHYERALEGLAGHLGDERVAGVLGDLDALPASEALLRAAERRAEKPGATARARLDLARLLIARREIARDPWFAREGRSPFDAFIAGRLDPRFLAFIREADPEALRAEAEELLESILDGRDAGDAGGDPLAEAAERELFALRHLGLGCEAPEIVGEGIDGRPMRLSDHRGKVVALVFWGTWCGPCMGMVPHERELVARLEGEPFALLGVNSDADREALKDRMEQEGITWPSWWDGPTTGGPIATRWNVRGWPDVYVIDHRGVIRAKDVRGEALDAAVDALLEELDAAGD